MPPDYSLYPGMDYDLGFTSRGCIRNCHFCVVPKKEGKFHRRQHPSEFHDPNHKKAVYLDNNILADKEWFFTVTDWLSDNRMAVDFNQGLDIRLIDYEIATRIKEMKWSKSKRFAYDKLEYREEVKAGIETLVDAGVNMRNDSMFYVFVEGDKDFSSALQRCKDLKEWGATPYPMLKMETNDEKHTQRMKNLKRWGRPWIFWSTDFESYKGAIK